MKTFTLLLSATIFTNLLFAQNIGIGTNSPNASALLDVSSTSKGVLLPRMTTIQRGAIASPATGLLVFDTDTKTIWTFDGTTWKNLYTSGGLTLPFSQTVNLGISAFQVTNQGIGAAIEGASTNEYGTGTIAKATGEYGRGLFVYTDKPGGNSIYAVADNGKVFHGENSNASNTNTLMSLLNRGLAKTATFQLANTSSNDANVQIAGNNLGEQLLIFQTNAANNKPAISVSNSGTGVGVSSVANNGTGVTGTSVSGIGIIGTSTSNLGLSGVSSTNYGVKGVTSSGIGFSGVYGLNNGTTGAGVRGEANFPIGIGVYGSSTNGTGVRGYGETNTGVYGQSSSGTALYGTSTTGYGLDVSGKVKIAGGNTSPSAGAVLTSIDASGNAVWKENRVAFRATGVRGSQTTIDGGYKRIHFALEDFDYGNDFNVLLTDAPDANSSVFTAPVSGVYQFNALAAAQGASSEDIGQATLLIRRNRNGSIISLASVDGYDTYSGAVIDIYDEGHFSTSLTVKLNAGDKIYVEIYVDAQPGIILGDDTQFSGFLVFAD